MNARHYDPSIARFMQEDTYLGQANDPLSLNLYTYCVNNPLIYYDPTGHWPEWLDNEIKYATNVISNKTKMATNMVTNEIKYVSNVAEQKATATWQGTKQVAGDVSDWTKEKAINTREGFKFVFQSKEEQEKAITNIINHGSEKDLLIAQVGYTVGVATAGTAVAIAGLAGASYVAPAIASTSVGSTLTSAISVKTATIGASFGAGSTYLGDVIENKFSGKTGADVFKPSSSIGTYLGNSVGGAVLSVVPGTGTSTGGARALNLMKMAFGEAAISTTVAYGVDVGIDYAEDANINEEHRFMSTFVSNSIGNLAGGVISELGRKVIPKVKMPKRNELRNIVRGSGTKSSMNEVYNSLKVATTKKVSFLNDSRESMIDIMDKVVGNFIGNLFGK